jgi:hypothetical protein
MSWHNVKIATPISKELAKVVGSLSTITTTLSTLANALVVLLEVAKTFILSTLEPFVLLVNAIITELENLINNLFSTGFYNLTVNPFELRPGPTLISLAEQRKKLNDDYKILQEKFRSEIISLEKSRYGLGPKDNQIITDKISSVKTRQDAAKVSYDNSISFLGTIRKTVGYNPLGIPVLSPRNAILAAIQSFDDLGDTNRPIFSDSAEVACIGFMATAPSLDQFLAIMRSFLAVFEVPDWRLALTKYEEIQNPSAVASVVPDWHSIKLNSFTPMDLIQKSLIGALNTMKGFKVTANSISSLISIMEARAQQLEKLSNDLTSLANAINSATGLFILNVPLQHGGVNLLKSQLRDAYLECQDNEHTILTLFVGGGPSAKSVDILRGLFLGS